jgi:DNA-directed RNA polymerase subunit RPC12/RpoP
MKWSYKMKCPGQDTRFWGPEAISEFSCPHCGWSIEFFKDESSRRCRKCGKKVLNPKIDFGCAVYCRFASQCLGTDMPPELLARKTDLLKDRVATEVKKILGRDFKRIGRTLKIIEYAEKIQKSEGGDPAVVALAARLSAVAGSTGGPGGSLIEFSGEETSAVRSILARTGAPEQLADEVFSILNGLAGSSRPDDSINFKCIFDAILIARQSETLKTANSATGANAVPDKHLLTGTGRRIIEEIMVQP